MESRHWHPAWNLHPARKGRRTPTETLPPMILRRFLPAGLAFAALLAVTPPRPAEALTITLDFVTGATTDALGVGTIAADYTAFGFTSMSTAQIQSAILSAVVTDYLGFPTVVADALSPLPANKQLNINFTQGSNNTTPPGNGDSAYFYVAIGKKANVGDTFLGQACDSCVRTSAGAGPTGVPNGATVGSILVDNIAALAGLASTDAQRINLLAETVAHEIGHSLSLIHPNGALANPGASAYSVMGTGAGPTNMPNGERVLDRAFAYSEFSQLIGAVGLRDVATPEPASWLLFAVGLGALRAARRRR